MNKKAQIAYAAATAAVAALLAVASAAAGGDPLVGTWHERDGGTSNMFYFVSEPVGGVYPILLYDDHSFLVCPDNGPYMWAGFAVKTATNAFQVNFGKAWCPDVGDGPHEGDAGPVSFPLLYDPQTDTITGAGGCIGTRQPSINTMEKAIQELAKGKYPPSGVDVNIGCEG